MNNEERWIDIEEVSAHLSVNRDSVYRWSTRLRAHRDKMLESLGGAQDAIDGQRDELIKRIDGQLRQRHAVKPVFCFRWRLA